MTGQHIEMHQTSYLIFRDLFWIVKDTPAIQQKKSAPISQWTLMAKGYSHEAVKRFLEDGTKNGFVHSRINSTIEMDLTNAGWRFCCELYS